MIISDYLTWLWFLIIFLITEAVKQLVEPIYENLSVQRIHFRCTRNPSQVYKESTSGVHVIQFECTRNPSEVYIKSTSGVQRIHLRCTQNPLFLLFYLVFQHIINIFSTMRSYSALLWGICKTPNLLKKIILMYNF